MMIEEDAAAAKLELVCRQNMATCFLKMGSPSEAIKHCNKALKLDKDGTAWKAKLRKGEAYLQMGRHDDAKDIFEVRSVLALEMYSKLCFMICAYL